MSYGRDKMKTVNVRLLRRAALAAAVTAAFSPAVAQQAETALTSEISAGVGVVDKDNQKFGEFSGLRDKGGYLLLDADVVRRNDASWMKLRGSNLGLDSRRLRFDQERQGDWGYFVEYDAIPRFAPYTVRTGVAGIGSDTQTVATTATPQSDYRFKTERENIAAGFNKLLGRGFNVQVRFRNEEKHGNRVFGSYSPLLFHPEPIDWTARQWEANVGYNAGRFQFLGGYQGSAYDNDKQRLNLLGGAFTPSFVALPPSNEAHQLHATGGYSFTQTTRGTFKLAYTRATQNEAFSVPTLGGQGSLDGRVDTKLMQLGLTMRPIPRLSLLADLRYEDRDDKTPQRPYITATAANPQYNGLNNPRSFESTRGKLEASYLLPAAIRLTGGVERDVRERSVPDARSVPYRAETEETAYRVELRRSLSETLTGAVAFMHEEREGSAPARATYNPATFPEGNVVMPYAWNDRDRDKVRVTLDWTATQRLSITAVLEDAKDKYASLDTFTEGLHRADSKFYSLDANFAVSDVWEFSAWLSRTELESHQQTVQRGPFATTTGLWDAGLKMVGDTYGAGVRAKPLARLQIGADLVHSYDRDRFDMNRLSGNVAVTSLPNIYWRMTSLKLFAKYALQRNYGVRLDFAHDRRSTDDWTWQNWVYPDGTRVIQNPKEKVNFVGISGYYQF